MSEVDTYLLKQARDDFDITQEDLAVKIGASVKTISRAENGEPISHYYVTQICKHFSRLYHRNIEPDELGLKSQRRTRNSIRPLNEPAPKTTETPPETKAVEKHSDVQATQPPSIKVLTPEQIALLSSDQLKGENMIGGQFPSALLQVLRDTGASYVVLPEVLYLQQKDTLFNEEQLVCLENEMDARWALYYTGGAAHVAPGLDVWLQTVTRCAQASRGTNLQERAHILLAMAYQLQSCVLRDMMRYTEAYRIHRKALLIAQEFYDPELIAATLSREGVTLNQQGNPLEAIECFKQGLETIKRLGYSILEGHLLQGLSEAQAKAQQPQESWQSIGQAEKALERLDQATPERSYVRITSASIIAQKGVNAVLLHDYNQALELMNTSLTSYDPTRIRGRARLIAQKAEAYYGLGIADNCVASAREALTLARSVGASKTITQIKNLHNMLIQSPWRKEQAIIELGDELSN